MKLRPKYSLKLVLLSATAVTVFLGYSQIRRKQLRATYWHLREDGYQFIVDDDLRDLIWQRKPTVATSRPDGRGPIYQRRDVVNRRIVVTELTDPKEIERLKRLGVVEYRGLNE